MIDESKLVYGADGYPTFDSFRAAAYFPPGIEDPRTMSKERLRVVLAPFYEEDEILESPSKKNTPSTPDHATFKISSVPMDDRTLTSSTSSPVSGIFIDAGVVHDALQSPIMSDTYMLNSALRTPKTPTAFGRVSNLLTPEQPERKLTIPTLKRRNFTRKCFRSRFEFTPHIKRGLRSLKTFFNSKQQFYTLKDSPLQRTIEEVCIFFCLRKRGLHYFFLCNGESFNV